MTSALDRRAAPDARVPSLAVPRPEVLADALTAPATDPVERGELEALRHTLTDDLQSVAGDLPAGERLRVDGFALRTARRHPEQCMRVDEAFEPTPRRCRRAIGLAAVRRCVRGASPSPSGAVADVLAVGVQELSHPPEAGSVRPPWWAAWYAGLPRGAQAVVHAEAVTWATRLLTAVAWERLGRPPVVGGRDDWWQCPGPRALVLQGRADARIPVDRRLALLVVGGGRCPLDWRAELAYPGLVAALVRDASAAPCRVVGVWPDSGQVRALPLDLVVLRATAIEVVAATATWVDARIEVRHNALTASGPRR